ncbi:hypothetical protein RHVP.52 [Cricetid gammaherpesvirus 2]|uniref:Virion protein G52 n=1 Tax=Cricetid gammaherpesvirus 2 TaxID=1605972 RepID=E9M5N5_9GAMA|nr:hypothetical protein RHVP.52 [Cricetid gammaherpesvirus 2]ADW24393.1 hypothetical protein RHVP.52 [Cricetid gammaherpesvirus 2]ADW24475.1 hypothetical protein RHVP-L.52 [Cricetid gammaherpesvirus 2]
MASKRTKEPSYNELLAQMQKLQLENKALRKKVGNSSSGGETVISPAKKESMILAACRSLSSLASTKIESKVRTKTAKIFTEQELVDALKGVRLRVDVSMEESNDSLFTGPASPSVELGEERRRRARSKSRSRHQSPPK